MLLGADWCYRGVTGQLVLLMDITGRTGVMGGMQREVRGPASAVHILGGVWIWEPSRGHSFSGCYARLCLVLQAWAGTPLHPLVSPRLPPPRMKCAETGGAARGKTPWRALTKGVLFKFV